ncbi:MAG: hypothetical protein WA902_15805 [Thermosynechococcaceae cyanobacterium]
MASNLTVKQKLLTQIDQLPETKLTEVLQFISTLQVHENQPTIDTYNMPDPLESFIGSVSHGSLAQNADTEVYGD